MPQYDVVIIGGGPSGATAGLYLARAGRRVALLEKTTFPRFQIGESLLPASYQILQDLGLIQRIKQLPHMPKFGSEFLFGNATESSTFEFDISLVGREKKAFNIGRADFDRLLLDMAVEAGVEVHMPATVNQIDHLEDGHVAVNTDDRQFTARHLFDASGQATLLGRRLGMRQALKEPYLQKVAYFEHFEGVQRRDHDLAGYPVNVMCDEGWFWIIPLNKQITSVGLVLDQYAVDQAAVPAEKMLAWGIERCPVMSHRMANAVGPDTNRVRSNYSYTCNPIAGAGYYLIGDAGMFIDPVFSSGICLGMAEAIEASKQVLSVLEGRQTPEAARRQYIRYANRGTKVFRGIVRHFYNHHFRELLLAGQGPLNIHRAVMSVLSGHIFPRMSFSVAWRFKLFELFIRLQRYWPIGARHQRFSLLNHPTVVPLELERQKDQPDQPASCSALGTPT